ncbi:MAG TPA: dienelactone hydrolase family protein [Candidatus Acidoferrales bacterium]|jgi:carboxymethylenebutenolidase|nr:dienelactone hydrolase family protein [Candidatus Acidoferrales bacterium]
MIDEKHDSEKANESSSDLSRRNFIAMSVAAGVAAASGTASAAAMPVTESDVTITTPDGMCDAAFIHPSTGSHPGVIIWTDAFGLRQSMRDIGKRIAAEGYTVLVPNPFYRKGKAPFFSAEEVESFNFQTGMGKIQPLMGSINAPGNVEKDATAFVAWLDKQKEVNKSKKMGTQGYCMGGPLVVKTCATAPNRVGAGGSFHGGGLVTDKPDSPHLLASKIKGRMYFGIASNDDMRQPDAKDKLRESFAAAHVPAEIEVYSSKHGWCVADMPHDQQGPIYNMADAEKAWGKLVALYKTALA